MGQHLITFSTFSLIYLTLMTLFPFITKIYRPPFVPKHVEIFFIHLTKKALRHRIEKKFNKNDYLDYMLQLKDQQNISDLELSGYCATFFIDGYETTCATMSFVLYCIAKHKDVQDRLRDEIFCTLNNAKSMNYVQLCELLYMDQVIYESQRLYPSIGTIGKKCTNTVYLDGANGKIFKVTPGMSVQIPVASIHWDPINYNTPMGFCPDRFGLQNGGIKKYEDSGKFLAFGLGPRECLGRRFGMAQLKTGLVELLRNYEITVNERTQEPIVFDPKECVLQAVGGIWLNFKQIPYR